LKAAVKGVRALAAYKDFFTLWKDADPDIPILREAKAEYGRLGGAVGLAPSLQLKMCSGVIGPFPNLNSVPCPP